MRAVRKITTVEVDLPFVQPILSSNGTMGGDSFACTQDKYYAAGYEAYKVFDNDSSTNWNTWNTSGSQTATLTIYNPVALNITSIAIVNYYDGNHDFNFSSVVVSGSNDGNSWESITSSIATQSSTNQTLSLTNDKYYKYYKFVCTSYWSNISTNSWNITATYKGTETFEYSLPKKLSTIFWKYIAATFNFVFSGTRSTQGWQSVSQSSNYLYGGSNAYEMGQGAYTQLMWTYTDTIPANTYSFNVYVSGQGNGYLNNPTVIVTYNDSTTETVYTKSWSGSSLNESFTFTASKPIKSIKATGTLTHSSVTYVGVNLTLTSLTHLVPVESTEDDYDYTTQEERICAFK